MRRVLALALVAALLTVSSVPQLARAACRLDTHAVHAGHGWHAPGHASAMHAMRTSRGGHYSCIECGCGCHRNINSLPHQLAPHAVMQPGVSPVQLTFASPAPPIVIPGHVATGVDSPPPQIL